MMENLGDREYLVILYAPVATGIKHVTASSFSGLSLIQTDSLTAGFSSEQILVGGPFGISQVSLYGTDM